MALRPARHNLQQLRLPHVVAVGGFDPTGGAGLVRDFWAATQRGATVVLLPTAWTDQSARGATGFEPRPVTTLARQLRQALADAPRGRTAVKVGMTATSELVVAIVEALDGFGGPIVFDPVLGASLGGALFAGRPADLLPLARRASLTTPNLDEAILLTGLAAGTAPPPAGGANLPGARRAAAALVAAGLPAVLVKGGHLRGRATDVLATGAGQRLFIAPRVAGSSPRGTGCSLATAIAAGLAAGRPLETAVGSAKRWLLGRIRAIRLSDTEYLL